ncbi:MAG: DUF3084 domain-containing protein [Vulcanimicrobiaceae bacterium]
MNFVDLVRGAGNILLIMAIAGAIAFVGDRVGHQVGRRRLTLFGIRPRYTSTIVAIGTGMLIALVVTMGAILFSAEVKTAFFKLRSINDEIAQLQSQEQALERKVNSGRLVVPTGELMVPFGQVLYARDDQERHQEAVHDYYLHAVDYINQNYPRLGLKPYLIPSDAMAKLKDFSNDAKMQALLAKGNVMIVAASDQNLYANDEIHFELGATQDEIKFGKGDPIAQLVIPGRSNASVTQAVSELEADVASAARQAHMAEYFLNVQPTQFEPELPKMQEMLGAPGQFIMTAYAAEDIYPHLGAIPIVIALAEVRPGQAK